VKIIDVNVLLYVTNTRAAEHMPALAWWEQSLAGPETIGIPWVVLLAFVRIATHPRIFLQPLTTEEALDKIARWLGHPNVRIVQESAQHAQLLLELIRLIGTAGNLTMDAHLAALAISHNATLVSCDTDFGRFRRLKWENPLAV
jgi:hypothetical protein